MRLFPGGDSPATAKRSPSKRLRLGRAGEIDQLILSSDLLTLSTPAADVASFVKAVCRRVFTLSTVWGTRRNLNAFLSTVDAYVRLGRQETFTLFLVCRGIKLSDLPWLKIAHTEAAQPDVTQPSAGSASRMDVENTQCSETETDDGHHHSGVVPVDPADPAGTAPPLKASRAKSLATMQIFYCFMEWVYCEFINPLIAANFYATEVEGRGAEVLYYRKPVWARIVQRGKEQLCNNFVPVSLSN
jgi:hypothetical protein